MSLGGTAMWAACVVAVAACGRTELLTLPDSGATTPRDSSVIAFRGDSTIGDQRAESVAGDATSIPEVGRDLGADVACASRRWTFGPIVKYAVPYFSGDVNGGPVLGAGDFDGDGSLDLLSLSVSPQAATIWSNLGDGTFELRNTFAVDAPVYVVAVGDFNRDGLADFALGFAGSSESIEVLTNQGAGTFAITSTFTVAHGGFKLAVADFNGDGAPDLAVGDGFEDLSVALNRGDGTFPSVVTYGTRLLVEDMAVGDVNRDGALDIVATSASFGSPSVGVLLNRGDGTFAPATTYPGICRETGPIALGDFNGDGWLDVARTCYQGGDTVAVRMNDGDGTFGSETSYRVGPWPWAIAVDRFLTSDGPLDIAAAPSLGADYGGTGISILPGQGDGRFGTPLGANSPTSNVLVAGDFDGDGHPDIAFAAGDVMGVLYFVCE